jgi:hypothetical protein
VYEAQTVQKVETLQNAVREAPHLIVAERVDKTMQEEIAAGVFALEGCSHPIRQGSDPNL